MNILSSTLKTRITHKHRSKHYFHTTLTPNTNTTINNNENFTMSSVLSKTANDIDDEDNKYSLDLTEISLASILPKKAALFTDYTERFTLASLENSTSTINLSASTIKIKTTTHNSSNLTGDSYIDKILSNNFTDNITFKNNTTDLKLILNNCKLFCNR